MGEAVRFARLTLLVRDHSRSSDGHVKSLWRCDCGKEAVVAFSRVKSGTTRSCGCLSVENSVARNTVHGMRGTPEYRSWMAMRTRCENPGAKDYPRYGGAGVQVDPCWSESFAAFFEHVGPRPDGTSLDRIDSTQGYVPGNVRWATPQEQGRNRRKTYVWHIRGRTFQSITEAARAFCVSEHTVSRWVNGETDNRRGTTTPPRADCHVVARYA